MQTAIFDKIVSQLAKASCENYKVEQSAIANSHDHMEHILVCLSQQHWNVMLSNFLWKNDNCQNKGREHKNEQVNGADHNVRRRDIVPYIFNSVRI